MDFLPVNIPSARLAVFFVPASLVYVVALVVWRLYFSQCARFPGSKLAAATGWYEFYYDYWLNGQYIFEIERMHKKYGELRKLQDGGWALKTLHSRFWFKGPIIRVTPDEISIHDPSFYNQVYVTKSTRRTDNYDEFLKGINFGGKMKHAQTFSRVIDEPLGSHLLTTGHDLHRKRRKPLEPFFSRIGIARLQPMLAELTRHCEARIQQFKKSNQAIRLDHAYTAFSGDVIQKICLGDESIGFLDKPDFAPEW